MSGGFSVEKHLFSFICLLKSIILHGKQIVNRNMDEMELMMHLHRNNKRQGPGSDEAINLALKLAKIDTDNLYKIADIGCGTGGQTISLAKKLKGEIVAVDLLWRIS